MASGGKGGEIEFRLKRRDERRMESGGNLESKELDRFKRVRKSRRGRVPNNATVFQNRANKRVVKSNDGGSGR